MPHTRGNKKVGRVILSEGHRAYNCLITRLEPAKLNIKSFDIKDISGTVDLRSQMPPVYDQGQLGSCTANALCAGFAYETHNVYMGSRLFVYYNERMLEHTISQDAGALLSDGINSLKKHGLCSETLWPYNIKKYTKKPKPKCYKQALAHCVISASNIQNTLVDMKQSLTAGHPFVVGIAIYDSFESDAVALTGIVPMPNINTESLLGGHAVLVVGYDDTHQWFIVRNSWGTDWGDQGYFYLPYAYLTDSTLTSDLWNITSVKV